VVYSGGAVAQLGARLDGIEEVVGSNPIGSTNSEQCISSISCKAKPSAGITSAGRKRQGTPITTQTTRISMLAGRILPNSS
jgi:hypothetical protein